MAQLAKVIPAVKPAPQFGGQIIEGWVMKAPFLGEYWHRHAPCAPDELDAWVRQHAGAPQNERWVLRARNRGEKVHFERTWMEKLAHGGIANDTPFEIWEADF